MPNHLCQTAPSESGIAISMPPYVYALCSYTVRKPTMLTFTFIALKWRYQYLCFSSGFSHSISQIKRSFIFARKSTIYELFISISVSFLLTCRITSTINLLSAIPVWITFHSRYLSGIKNGVQKIMAEFACSFLVIIIFRKYPHGLVGLLIHSIIITNGIVCVCVCVCRRGIDEVLGRQAAIPAAYMDILCICHLFNRWLW